MIMRDKISPSMMCADVMQMADILNCFERNNIEYLHIDVMDGVFVPNYQLGTDFCKIMKKNSKIPLDIHLMVENPEIKLSYFEFGSDDIVSIHAETTKHIQRVLTQIKQKGAKAFLALNPATPISYLDYLLDDIDGVMLMTVNPGFAGQNLIPQCLKKIEQVRALLDARGYSHIEIEVDGNVSFENIPKMKKAGANIFVGGTSSVFNQSHAIDENIAKMRELFK